MKKNILFSVLLCCAAGLSAQYRIDLSNVVPSPLRYLEMGDPGPDGKEILINNLYWEEGGKPKLPVMGEFHYNRMDERYWRENLMKMKASGVDIVSTYTLWVLHEEFEGRQSWEGRNNLRKFVQLCHELGLKVHLRIGPYCNAEIRNGGFPDWIEKNESFRTRTNDPVYLESDGLYHLFGARWPESKGFDAWPTSRVYHAVSASPTGPFKVVHPDIGRGHNVTCFRSRYGDYIISGLFKDYIGKSVDSPWRNWKILLDFRGGSCPDTSNNTYTSREDGSVLMINQPGRVWISEDGVKPFRKVTDAHGVHPCTLGIFEDPIIWRDEIQYHAIYNDWYGRTAYYMRSKDGVNWVWDPGIAYDFQVAKHPDGTSERWYKYERPSVLLDKYGRASHIYFAVIDSRKDLDKPNDNHNTKNIVLPLIVSRRLELMEKDSFLELKDFTVRIKGEPGFSPEKDVDVSSLRFGAPAAVDLGKGLSVKSVRQENNDLIVVFSGTSAGFTANDFVGKMLGKDNAGKPVFGYIRLPGVSYNDPIIDAGRPKIQNGELWLTVENFGMVDSEKGTVLMRLERNGAVKETEMELPVIPAYQHADIRIPLDVTWLTGEGGTVLDLTIHGGGVPWKYKEVFQTGVVLRKGNEVDLTLPVSFNSADKLLLATGQTFEKGMALHSPGSYTWMLDGSFDELHLSVGAAKASLGGSVFEIWGDGKLLVSTPLLRPKSIYPELHHISIPVKGIYSLSFVVNRFFVHDKADTSDIHIIVGEPKLIKNYMIIRILSVKI